MAFFIYCSACKVMEPLDCGKLAEAKALVALKKKDTSFECKCEPTNTAKWTHKEVREKKEPVTDQPVVFGTDSTVNNNVVLTGLTPHTIEFKMDLPGGGIAIVNLIVYTGKRSLYGTENVALMAHGRQCGDTPVGGFGGGPTDLGLAIGYVCPIKCSLYRFAAYPKAVAAVKKLVDERESFVTYTPNALLGPHSQGELQGVEMEPLVKCVSEVVEGPVPCDFAMMVGYQVRDNEDVVSLACIDEKIPFYIVGQALKSFGYRTTLLLACRSPWNGTSVANGLLPSGDTHQTCSHLYNPIKEIGSLTS